MTLAELYDGIGGTYSEALMRLSADSLVERFIVRFLDDSSIRDLLNAWEKGDVDACFKAAHTAKGVTGNLSLTHLCDLCTQICEALRPGNEELRQATDLEALIGELSSSYARDVELIRAYVG